MVYVRNIRMIAMGAALAMAAGMAVAQDQGGEFKKPLARSQYQVAQPSSSTSQTWTMIQSSDDDGDSYELTIKNGEVSAKVNGKAIPADRVRRSDSKVEILDKKGNVVKTFDVTMNSAGSGAKAGRIAKRQHDLMPDQPQAIVVEGVHPKVMVGITMSQPSEALAEHLSIKPDEAVVVERVIDGLPAERAGLKIQDIIVDVDGVHPVTQENFRETINKKEPGDKVTLKILRKGEEKKITVELQKFDGEKLGIAGMQPGAPGADQWQQFQNMQDMPGGQEWQEHMKEALKQGKNAWVFSQGPGEHFQFTPFGGTDPRRMDEMQSQIDKKIAELDEKLAKINDQMERLEKLLSKMGEKQGR